MNATHSTIAPRPKASDAPRFLLAVDPGLRCSGVALFMDQRFAGEEYDAEIPPRVVLMEAGVALGIQATDCDDAIVSAIRVMVGAILNWCGDAIARAIGDPENPPGTYVARLSRPNDLVVEWPKVYTRDKSKGDSNDLLALAGVCAAVAQACDRAEVRHYLPRSWKGTVDGDAMTLRIESRLRQSGELDRVLEHRKTHRHNAVDAAGLGLHHLGRLRAPRVVPR